MSDRKYSPEEIQEIAEIMGAVVEEKVETCVYQAFHTYKQEYFVEPEGHYQDHLQMKQCRENKKEWKDNHRIISELKKNDDLENSVRFALKLEKREKFVVKKAWQSAVVVGLAIIASRICSFFGVDLPLEKVFTLFK